MDYWKGLNGSYDAANGLLIMFHDELTLTYENLGRPDFMLQEKYRSYKPTKIRKIKSNRSEQGKARRDDSREE